MSFSTHIEQFRTFEHSGAFDFSEFLDHLKDWFERRGYDVSEKEYVEKKKDPKSHKITWSIDRDVDDYHQYVMKLVIELQDFKEVEKDKKKYVDGDLKITLEFADVKRDYEEGWQSSPVKRFARAVYDKFIMEDKESEINKKLKEDTESLFKEIRQYFS